MKNASSDNSDVIRLLSNEYTGEGRKTGPNASVILNFGSPKSNNASSLVIPVLKTRVTEVDETEGGCGFRDKYGIIINVAMIDVFDRSPNY